MSASASVVVADLGSGNLRSVEKALAAVGARVAISADADTVARAEKLVVPGQGAFGACAAGLDRGGGAMRQAVHDVIRAGRPFFGICIGMNPWVLGAAAYVAGSIPFGMLVEIGRAHV